MEEINYVDIPIDDYNSMLKKSERYEMLIRLMQNHISSDKYFSYEHETKELLYMFGEYIPEKECKSED